MTKDNLMVEMRDFCKKFEITKGWTQEQHASFVQRTLVAVLGIERKEDKQEIYDIVKYAVNPSSLRQDAEKPTLVGGAILAPSGGKSGEIASRYADLANGG